MSVVPKILLTGAEYLQGELLAEIKHELVDCEAFAMAGASADHNRISINFVSELSSQLKGTPCEPFIADMKVSVEGNFFYPDVMVVCDEHKEDTNYVKYAPKLIVEVLSKSTRAFDHSIKLGQYLKIPLLEYYVIIEQDFCEIAVLARADGFIPKYYYLGDQIEFPLVKVIISVNDIYDRIENEDQERYAASLLDLEG